MDKLFKVLQEIASLRVSENDSMSSLRYNQCFRAV